MMAQIKAVLVINGHITNLGLVKKNYAGERIHEISHMKGKNITEENNALSCEPETKSYH